MKYKHTRKEAIELARNKGYGFKSLEKLLLAKQENKKESGCCICSSGTRVCEKCKENINEYIKEKGLYNTINFPNNTKIKFKEKFDIDEKFINPTPSPLDSIEEVEEIDLVLTSNMWHGKTINSLIRNQTKIINYLKGKK